MSGSNTRRWPMLRAVTLIVLLPLLGACATNSPPPIVVPQPKLPAPDPRWMKTPELPPSCATWSDCAQRDISDWEQRLTNSGAI